MKLHLGCGQRYLEGYINIDFPLSKHTVQRKSVADLYCDITKLTYKPNSIEEIRLHHVFEHFDRPTACGLIAAWHSWLIIGGKIHIEVPDFYRTAKVVHSFFNTMKSKKVALRHLFGSHEAFWAIHKEGYTKETLLELMSLIGFSDFKVMRNSWKGTYNIEVIGIKNTNKTYDEYLISIEKYLSGFLVDETEESLLKIWMNMAKNQLDICLRGHE